MSQQYRAPERYRIPKRTSSRCANGLGARGGGEGGEGHSVVTLAELRSRSDGRARAVARVHVLLDVFRKKWGEALANFF